MPANTVGLLLAVYLALPWLGLLGICFRNMFVDYSF